MFPTSISQPCLYFSEAVVLFGTNGLLQSTVLIAVGLVIGREEANAAPEESSPKSEGVSSTTTQEAKQITVHGNVLSPDGQPVAGAIVHAGVGLWANLKWLAGPDAKPPVSEAKTRPSGEFTVSVQYPAFWRPEQSRPRVAGHVAANRYCRVSPRLRSGMGGIRGDPAGETHYASTGAGRADRGPRRGHRGQARRRPDHRRGQGSGPPTGRTSRTGWPASRRANSGGWIASPEHSPESAGIAEQVTTDEQGRFEIRGVGRERHLNLTFKSETLAYQVIGVVTRDMKPIQERILDRPTKDRFTVPGSRSPAPLRGRLRGSFGMRQRESPSRA